MQAKKFVVLMVLVASIGGVRCEAQSIPQVGHLAPEAPVAATGTVTEAQEVAAIEKLNGRFSRDDKLPGKPIVGLYWFNEKVTDADLENFEVLKDLRSVKLILRQLTDRGAAHLRGFTALRELELGGRITDESLKMLKEIKQLELLDLSGDKLITDDGLENIEGLQHLKTFNVYSTGITDKGLAHVKDLTELENMGLGNTKITDAGLEQLTGLTKLDRLALNGCHGISNAGLEHLAALPKLETMFLEGTRLNDEGMAILKTFPALKKLEVDGCIDDKGLEIVAQMPELTRLGVGGSPMTDEGLLRLAALKKLEFVDVFNTHVTKEGIKKLQQVLPRCQILTTVPHSIIESIDGKAAPEYLSTGSR